METKKECGIATQELTSSEINLAIAQIKDRLSRLIKCHNEIEQVFANGNGSIEEEDQDDEGELVISEAKKRFDIPDGVDLMVGEFSFPRERAREVMRWHDKWIGDFVRGRLSREIVEDIAITAYDFHGFDFGWVYLGEVLRDENGFLVPWDYPGDTTGAIDQMIEIGTRKNKLSAKAVEQMKEFDRNAKEFAKYMKRLAEARAGI